MTLVLIHGVPETPAIWDDLIGHLHRPLTTLRLPGFGRGSGPALDGKEAYAAWLADELLALDGPIDVLAHDWGAHLATRAVTAYDVPVRSWATDVLGTWHPDNDWHPVARLWQSADGEAALRALRERDTAAIQRYYGVPAGGFADLLSARDMPRKLAEVLEAEHDDAMSTAILALYRSANANLHADWGRELPAASPAPGLVLSPTEHPPNNLRHTAEMAGKLGMRLAVLDGMGHSWMATHPAKVAPVLTDFWDSVTAGH
ncbi:alpha/beta fold hydrolase [Streptomyces xiangluensis]|uniref:Alpha/beta fold hydrolase n=1 Tax=Streptomyces xiangluensis TaxID=2665720 RepID=A0ABV8Z1W5_9ACTN